MRDEAIDDMNKETTQLTSNTRDECRGTRTSFLARIDFQATPATFVDGVSGSERAVGQQFRHRFNVVDGAETGIESSARAEMLLASFSNWLLTLSAVQGGGVSFDVGTKEQGNKLVTTVKRQVLQ